MNKLLVSCLEPSANLHLGEVLRYLDKDYKLVGIFDECFGDPIYKSSEFSAMGFTQVLPLVLKAKHAIKQMTNLARECDTVLLIDSPAFNLPLAKSIKQAGIKTKIIYYILPQVWAWKRKRVNIVQKYCDKLASILPFDSQFYDKSIYVGHPLLDEIRFQKEAPSNSKIVSFLPGSRRAEISNLMPHFRSVADKINGKKLLVVPSFLTDKIDQIYGDVSGFEIVSNTPQALYSSDFAFICSGTATLEAALIGTPFVLAYKARALDIFIARLLVKLKYVGLANIMFDFMGKEALNLELIQNDVNDEKLMHAYKHSKPEIFIKAALELRRYLGHGSSQNVAKMIKGEI